MRTPEIQRLARLGLSALILVAGGLAQRAFGGTLAVVYQIPGVAGGRAPIGALTELNGTYYGVTWGAGEPGASIYSIDLRTRKETLVYRFDDGGVSLNTLLAFDGKLYGGTTSGGVFSFDPTTGTEATLFQLPDGGVTSSLVARHGMLYGGGDRCGDTDGGCLFGMDPASGIGQILHSFSKASDQVPNSLTWRAGTLFGTSYNSGSQSTSGTIFQLQPATNDFKTDYSFEGTGLTPASSLLDINGIFYGTTSAGGSSRAGTVYTYDPANNRETLIYSFNLTNGRIPSGDLLDVDGLIYGTTAAGGSGDNGALFSLDPASGQVALVLSFGTYGCSEPSGGAIEAHGLLYGALGNGGVAGAGCVYSVDPAAAQLSVLHEFAGAIYSGAVGLTKSGPDIFGVAAGGGEFGLGSIFRFHPATNTAETLYSFDGIDGGRPSGALTEVGGLFYGTTRSGGVSNAGGVFSFDSKTRTLTTLHAFAGDADGGNSSSHLVLAGSALFGITSAAPFKIDLDTGQFSTLSAGFVDTAAPDLTLANGLLYGVTQYGGSDRSGSIFSIDPATGAATIQYSFPSGKPGVYPDSDQTYSDGMLYGLTASDVSNGNFGVFYQFDPSTGARATLHVFHHAIPRPVPPTAVGDHFLGIAELTARNPANAAIMHIDQITGLVTFHHAIKTGIDKPITPLVCAGGSYYFDAAAGCDLCEVQNAGTIYKLTP